MGLLDQLLGGPLVKLTPNQQKHADKETQRLVIEEGRAARRAGLPKDHFIGNIKIAELNSDWHNGWRWEDEEIKAREAKGRT